MNTPNHPWLVHLPLALAFLIPLLVAFVGLAWWRKWLPARTWVLVVAACFGLAASGYVALQAGEADEERVEHRVPEAVLETHEHAGKRFLAGSGVLLVISVLPLLFRRTRLALPLVVATGVASLVVFGLAFQTGKSGGALVWTEKRL